MKYKNPIIPGFFPDPSICTDGEMFYLVCSSFQYFPGVPLFESRDLINWRQIGHVLTKKSQLPLMEAGASGGIYAPTIRYNEGRFYMVTTNVSAGGNFYVYTDDIHGEWSEPIFVEQGGIDPSLYFEDGKAYFMSNGEDDQGIAGITQCEIDIETGKKLTPGTCIWNGAGGRYLESPHLYKINGAYYIMAAEGGTEYGHMVVYAKGNSIYGPFENYEKNPVLTNRNLGGYPIQGCGHADLVCDKVGNWWMVHLAFRQTGRWENYHITGREVYLVEVTFDENGWFTAGSNGTTLSEMESDRLDALMVESDAVSRSESTSSGSAVLGSKIASNDESESGNISISNSFTTDRDRISQQNTNTYITFENSKVGVEWCFQRNPKEEHYKKMEDGWHLTGDCTTLSDTLASPTFLAIRQTQMYGNVSCEVDVDGGEAGLSLFMDEEHHYDLFLRKTTHGYEVGKRICIGDIKYEQEVIQINRTGDNVPCLQISLTPTTYTFEVDDTNQIYPLGTARTRYLSTEVASGFTGVMIGIYAQATADVENYAIFRRFIADLKDE